MEWVFPLFGLFWLATIVVTIVALVDCIRVPDDSMFQNGTKLIWVLVIVFLSLIGAILYFAIGRPKRGATPTARTVPPPPPPPV
jgi:uncharacterized RDD family membrane protein YckC